MNLKKKILFLISKKKIKKKEIMNSTICDGCQKDFSSLWSDKHVCLDCEKCFCEEDFFQCEKCQREQCISCSEKCSICLKEICPIKKCQDKCMDCGSIICSRELEEKDGPSCFLFCFGCQNMIGIDCAEDCSFCEGLFCKKCMMTFNFLKICIKCQPGYVCSKCKNYMDDSKRCIGCGKRLCEECRNYNQNKYDHSICDDCIIYCDVKNCKCCDIKKTFNCCPKCKKIFCSDIHHDEFETHSCEKKIKF